MSKTLVVRVQNPGGYSVTLRIENPVVDLEAGSITEMVADEVVATQYIEAGDVITGLSTLKWPRSIPKPCTATLRHGPGHQSTTECELVGEHAIHQCHYGEFSELAYWRGDSAATGYFDEPPSEPEE